MIGIQVSTEDYRSRPNSQGFQCECFSDINYSFPTTYLKLGSAWLRGEPNLGQLCLDATWDPRDPQHIPPISVERLLAAGLRRDQHPLAPAECSDGAPIRIFTNIWQETVHFSYK